MICCLPLQSFQFLYQEVHIPDCITIQKGASCLSLSISLCSILALTLTTLTISLIPPCVNTDFLMPYILLTALDPVSAGDGDGDKTPPPRDPLVRTGKPFFGMIEDIKIRYSVYLSDLKDGIDGQVAAAAIFIFFAALSAAITFGGMYGKIMCCYTEVSNVRINIVRHQNNIHYMIISVCILAGNKFDKFYS